jgi:hypothetical protein
MCVRQKNNNGNSSSRMTEEVETGPTAASLREEILVLSDNECVAKLLVLSYNLSMYFLSLS